MSPARAAPGWSPSRAVLAGRDAPARVRARAALRGARQALVEAEVGRVSGPRAVGRRTTQLKLVTGQPQGQPHPTYFRPRRPRASPTRPRPSSDLSAAPSTAAGAVKAHMYSSEPTSVTPLQRRGARLFCPPAHRGASRQGQITARVTPSSRGQHIARKQAAPAARLAEPAREAPAGGRAPHANKTPPGAKLRAPCRSCPRAWRSSTRASPAM